MNNNKTTKQKKPQLEVIDFQLIQEENETPTEYQA